jgi:plasmid stabilization system protein ParE
MRLVVDVSAWDDLNHIGAWIARDNPRAARTVLEKSAGQRRLSGPKSHVSSIPPGHTGVCTAVAAFSQRLHVLLLPRLAPVSPLVHFLPLLVSRQEVPRLC